MRSRARMAFFFASPLVALGYRRQLQYEDLPPLDAETVPEAAARRLWARWAEVCVCANAAGCVCVCVSRAGPLSRV